MKGRDDAIMSLGSLGQNTIYIHVQHESEPAYSVFTRVW